MTEESRKAVFPGMELAMAVESIRFDASAGPCRPGFVNGESDGIQREFGARQPGVTRETRGRIGQS